jgi:hypothetical protein
MCLRGRVYIYNIIFKFFSAPVRKRLTSVGPANVDATRVRANAVIYPRGNFITDATVRLSHNDPAAIVLVLVCPLDNHATMVLSLEPTFSLYILYPSRP